jgi:hypothetical protein
MTFPSCRDRDSDSDSERRASQVGNGAIGRLARVFDFGLPTHRPGLDEAVAHVGIFNVFRRCLHRALIEARGRTSHEGRPAARIRFSVGYDLTETIRAAILEIPTEPG